MAGTYKETVLLKLSKPELVQLLLTTEANMHAHIASLTAGIKRINQHLKKLEADICYEECELPFSRLLG